MTPNDTKIHCILIFFYFSNITSVALMLGNWSTSFISTANGCCLSTNKYLKKTYRCQQPLPLANCTKLSYQIKPKS